METKSPVSFEQYQFELIESDITDFSKHAVAILFFTPLYYMQEKLGEFLVLSQKIKETQMNQLIALRYKCSHFLVLLP